MSKVHIPVPENLISNVLTPLEEMLEIRQKNSKLFIGLPCEHGFQENRIALIPSAVKTLTAQGHRVVLETGAGLKSNFSDRDYSEAGAEIVHRVEDVFKAHVILKAAPLTLEQIDLCTPNQIILSPIHLPTLSADYIFRLKEKRVIALAMEYIKDQAGTFPFVRVMSEMAGIGAIQTASELLSRAGGGRGVLLGGISGVPPAKVVILGAGVVSEYATRAALGFGAEVRVFDNNIRKLMRLQHNIGRQIYTSTIDPTLLTQELSTADVAIGAIHAENGRTPVVVSEDMVERMQAGSVIIDISIDQGGCFATSEVTSHKSPTFIKHDVVHYCVPNIASRTPRTGSTAFSNIITPLLLEAGDKRGIEALIKQYEGLQHGVYVYKSCLTNEYMGQRYQMKHTDLKLLLASSL